MLAESASFERRSGLDLSNRVILGTAQLGLAYGRRTGAAPLEEREAFDILDASWDAGFRIFDTAEAYGTSATRLARWLGKGNRLSLSSVITKLGAEQVGEELLVRAACARFEGAASLTLLSHGAIGAELFASLRRFAIGAGADVGQSVYTPAEIREAADAGCRRVQAPANVFDTRQIEAARGTGIALDVRSVFLQGVLLDSPEVAARRAPGADSLAARVRFAAQEAGTPAPTALIAAVLAQLGPADRLIIGIDMPSQVDDVAAAFEVPAERVREFLNVLGTARPETNPDPRLLDPRTWPLSR
jgi:aryl-alcohol dehydrogenase-like predicted oxidoreductase